MRRTAAERHCRRQYVWHIRTVPAQENRTAVRAPLSVSNRWRDFVPVMGLRGYGTWEPYTWNNQGQVQHGVRLLPQEPPWRRLFASLDGIGADLDGAPVSLEDEVDAIVACCWRYGTYLHSLTGGEIYPAFRPDPDLSRLHDPEMQRVNIEFSAALAEWLFIRQTDPTHLARRVRAALGALPTPWRSRRAPWWEDFINSAGCRAASSLSDSASQLNDYDLPRQAEPSARLRQEANWAVLSCYRNGPIESLHAGNWSHGADIPGFLRLYAPDLVKVAGNMVDRLGIWIVSRELMPANVLELCASLGAPRDWSLTESTSTVDFSGMPGVGPLTPRLEYLGTRFPTVFGTAPQVAASEARRS